MDRQRTATEQALAEQEAKYRFGPPPAEVQNEEQFWIWWLDCLRREYVAASEFAVNKLADIQARKPRYPIFIVDEASDIPRDWWNKVTPQEKEPKS